MNSIILSYRGIDIPLETDFENGNPTMVNATKMLQCFPGKKMNNFLRAQQTQDYIVALKSVTGLLDN